MKARQPIEKHDKFWNSAFVRTFCKVGEFCEKYWIPTLLLAASLIISIVRSLNK